MLKWFRADLHVHTCLSPCADLSMSPRRIVAGAQDKHLDVIAITDHNAVGNVAAVRRAAEATDLAVLAGVEVCTREEVHVLAIFDEVSHAHEFGQMIFNNLSGRNDPRTIGLQVLANEFDEVEGFEEKLLIGAVDCTVEEMVQRIHALQGLAIASHVDRESYGILGQLGFIPADLPFDALEVSGALSEDDARKLFREYERYPFVRNSDAHGIGALGSALTRFKIDAPCCEEIRRALRKENGRVAVPELAATGH